MHRITGALSLGQGGAESGTASGREAFLHAYQESGLHSQVCPEALGERYRPVACLKDGERQVYLVQDQDGRPAVLKVQPAGREDTLRQEYELLRQLHHPQLPRALDYLESHGREYLVREYVEGVSLYDLVMDRGPFPQSQAKAVAISLCQVLQDLHSQNPPVICRDVKPQNVVLDGNGRCHLIDLGAARRYRPDQGGDTVFLGTETTAPPEQFGYQQTDQRSDIYSLGMLLRFLLSGSYGPLAGASGTLGRIVRKCTAFDPEDRYSSAQAVIRALEGRWLRRAGVVGAAVVCAVVLLAALRPWAHRTVAASPLMEAALRQELGLSENAPIPADRLEEVEQLLVCGEILPGTLQEHEQLAENAHDFYVVEPTRGDIDDQDLALLTQCPNLRVLILDYQQITDLSSLAGLPLEYLSLVGNQISDLSPLEGCETLQTVDLGENPVRSADVLADLPALREVGLEATGITSVEAFAGSNIQFINIRTTWVTDYTPLEDCPRLTRLITGSMPDGAVETLAGLTSLEELRLYSTAQVDLSHFADFQQLQEVDFFGSTISHPEALTGLSALRSVNLGETGTKDLSFLPAMQALTYLDLRENAITDLTPLLECPWLTQLILSPRHRPLAQEQLSQASFEIIYRE